MSGLELRADGVEPQGVFGVWVSGWFKGFWRGLKGLRGLRVSRGVWGV